MALIAKPSLDYFLTSCITSYTICQIFTDHEPLACSLPMVLTLENKHLYGRRKVNCSGLLPEGTREHCNVPFHAVLESRWSRDITPCSMLFKGHRFLCLLALLSWFIPSERLPACCWVKTLATKQIVFLLRPFKSLFPWHMLLGAHCVWDEQEVFYVKRC